jgi:hypothetical protein
MSDIPGRGLVGKVGLVARAAGSGSDSEDSSGKRSSSGVSSGVRLEDVSVTCVSLGVSLSLVPGRYTLTITLRLLLCQV